MTPRRLIFFIVGAIAYLVALVAGWPARFAVSASPRWAVAGTIWTGEAVLDGAYRIEWRWARWRSLASLAYAADVRLSGSGTDVAGAATRVRGGYRFDGLSGRADGALLNALVPSLAFTCDTSLQIDLPRLQLSGATSGAVGEVRADGGSCAAKGGSDSTPLPPLIASAQRQAGDATAITLAPVGQGRRHLVDAAIANGHLTVTPTRDGIATLPLLALLRIDSAL